MSDRIENRIQDFERSLFTLSRGKTIALIIIAVLLLGAVGALAGTLMSSDVQLTDPAEPQQENSMTAWLSRDLEFTSPPLSPGARTLAAGLLAQEQTPTEGGAGTTTPEPQPTDPGATGGAVNVGGVFDLVVPPPWQVTFQDDDEIAFADGANDYVWEILQPTDRDATALAEAALLGYIVENPAYSNMENTATTVVTPFGSLTSAALLKYRGTWTDNQGATTIQGALFVAVRQDGLALVATAEAIPMERYEEGAVAWADLVNESFQGFAGI